MSGFFVTFDGIPVKQINHEWHSTDFVVKPGSPCSSNPSVNEDGWLLDFSGKGMESWNLLRKAGTRRQMPGNQKNWQYLNKYQN